MLVAATTAQNPPRQPVISLMKVPAGPPRIIAMVSPLTTTDRAFARRLAGASCTAVDAATAQKQA